MTIIFIGLLFNYCLSIFVSPGFLGTEENKKELEYIVSQKPELVNIKRSGNYCILCQTPRICRSQHCIYCKQQQNINISYARCILRFENHSIMLNICLGAYNLPFYVALIFFVQTYFWFMLFAYILPTKVEVQKSLIDLPIIVIAVQQLNYFSTQLGVCVLRILYNITSSELSSWRRFPYLWKTERGDFGNPFDKGFIQNTLSFYRPIFNKILGRKSKLPTIDWGTAKFINVMDIPDHPLSNLFSEQMMKQFERQRQMEREMIKQQIRMQEQQMSFREPEEDKQRLLENQ